MTPNDEPARPPDPDQEPPRLPHEAVVVRFGASLPDTLRKTVLAHHDERSDFAISCVSLPDRSADDLARLGALPHPKIRETTVGMLREAGYDVVRDEPPEGHALVTLPRLPTDEDYVTISNLFGPPRLNPATSAGGTSDG